MYNAPLTNYPAGELPRHFLPGLNAEEQQLLLGALPYASASIKNGANSVAKQTPGAPQSRTDLSESERLREVEEAKNEQMLRLMDLRNANKAGIEAVNRQRVIEEFGRKVEGAGLDSGSSEVQGMWPFLPVV